MTTITNMPLFRAAVIASALKLYHSTGIKANRAYTPTAMLKAANEITGHHYRRGQYLMAAEGILAWIDQKRAEGETMQTDRQLETPAEARQRAFERGAYHD